MIVLAIDTAGADCAAGLYDTDRRSMLSEVTENIGRGHAEKLIAVIDTALDQAGLQLDAVGRIAVTVGPGSFTGIRVGVAAARGFALALGIEAVGISTLAVLAAGALDRRRRSGSEDTGKPVLAAIDAKRGEVYLQLFSSSGRPLDAAFVLPLDGARQLASGGAAELVGSGASLLAGDEVAVERDRFPIALVARLALEAESGKPRPLYLRGPDAKPQVGFAVARM